MTGLPPWRQTLSVGFRAADGATPLARLSGYSLYDNLLMANLPAPTLGVACIVAAVALSACGQGHTGCSVSPCPTVPQGLAGKRLSDVEDELSRDTNPLIQFTIAGGGGFSFVARNWGVCSTTPSAGQPIDTVLILYIRHFACGAKRGFAGSQRVPRDLVGKHVQDVGSELVADNIEFTAQGVDLNAIVSAEWGVCSTTPSARQPIDGQLVLHIRHFTCGARKPSRG